MSDWKEIVKGGWHPEKEGTTLKSQVKGLVGRGDKSSSSSHSNHTATPITSLRDPSSFGPPPKHVAAGGSVSPARSYTPPAPSQTFQSNAPPPLPAKPAYPSSSSSSQQQPHHHQAQQTQEPPAEPRPYRLNTTGLDTSHLPPPPVRRDGADGHDAPPPPYSPFKSSGPPSLPPRLPPRSGTSSPLLPPRSGTSSPAHAPSPTSPGGHTQPGHLNQGAVNRLGAAGISVPGFGIGAGTGTGTGIGGPGKATLPPPPPPPARASPTSTGSGPSPTRAADGQQLNELQSRFSRLGSTPQPESGSATQGTTWAQKQAALRTASSFHKDPSSVSFADAKAAAGTANNFHQRHGDQVASGMRTANGLGQRFGVGAGAENGATKTGNGEQSRSPMGQVAGVLGKKKPPPPPPKKPAGLSEAGERDPVPPPVPLATRPNFG